MGVATEVRKSSTCFPVRYVQVLMLFLGMTFAFSAKVMMSIAIVAMTNPNVENSFSWSIQRQSIILSTFTWGYMILQSVTGQLASRFGGMILMVICLGVNSVVSLLIPVLATYGDWITVCICRLIQGLSQGLLLPSVYHLIGNWVPTDERSRMTNIIFGGGSLGTAGQLILSGYIANYWGWPAIFYSNGLIGLIWSIAYIFIGSDSPQASNVISDDERLFIQSSLKQTGQQKRLQTPWKSILTSLPYLSAILANVGGNWGFWTLLTEIPTYMNSILGVNIKSNGVMSALPFISMFVMSFPIGYASDYVLRKKWIGLTACRKISNSIGFFGPAIALICLTYVPHGNVAAAVLLLVTALGLNAGFYSGYNLVHMDMAPNFASTMMGIANFVANFVSAFAPLAVGLILKDETNPTEWYTVFYIAAAMYTITNLLFIIFSTSKRQEWNEKSDIK